MALKMRLKMSSRFFLLLLPRVLLGRCTATRAAGYAADLSRSGNGYLAEWCWRWAVDFATDEGACEQIVRLRLETGDADMALTLAQRYFDRNGMHLSTAVRLTGLFVLKNACAVAYTAYKHLLQRYGDDLPQQWPSPSWPCYENGDELLTLLDKCGCACDRQTTVTEDTAISFARFCFCFEAFDISATLYDRVRGEGRLEAEDQVAYAYSLLRSNRLTDLPPATESLPPSPELVSDPDWQILLATVLFVVGRSEEAASIVSKAVYARLGDHPEVEDIALHCTRIVQSVARCREAITIEPVSRGGFTYETSGRRKIFVCGNGWSGSGALYDAITEYDGFVEAPNTPLDRYVNACTGNEMMLIQGASGLGVIWRQARQAGTISKLDLWDLFRCHLLGGGAIGHTEHKGAKTAVDLLVRTGTRYSALFVRLFDELSEQSANLSAEHLHKIFLTATEAFSSLLADGKDDAWVAFNNAIFGSNIDMLEIFSNYRAAVVVRDPLDQFTDRRNQDIKHWMTARRFATVYRDARRSIEAKRQRLPSEHAKEISVVEFERFVLDEAYRRGVLSRLLEGRVVLRVSCRFVPSASAGNIGIHAASMGEGERFLMESKLKEWCRTGKNLAG